MRISTVCLLLFALCLAISDARAQPRAAEAASVPVHAVPFASEGNRIELVVANTLGQATGPVQVTVAEHPAWLEIAPTVVTLEAMEPGGEALAVFHFSVPQTAPVGVAEALRFDITGTSAQVAMKQLRLEVEAPREVALHGNYPNPFNPTTTLGYALPRTAQVRLVVYDVLGREVATLVRAEQEAGYHEATWSAGDYASGMYLYRLVVEAGGQRAVKQATMLLVK